MTGSYLSGSILGRCWLQSTNVGYSTSLIHCLIYYTISLCSPESWMTKNIWISNFPEKSNKCEYCILTVFHFIRVGMDFKRNFGCLRNMLFGSFHLNENMRLFDRQLLWITNDFKFKVKAKIMHYTLKYTSALGKCQGFWQINNLIYFAWQENCVQWLTIFFLHFQIKGKKLGTLFPWKEILLTKLKA